ncbi:PIN domain-containing protein [Dyadobacter pollutisoli]|uniref:PIN domain-containing protein n=1 Tax=Dyadobacter pollutisoli TaxID=2910158 RepID=A0A9E8NEY2_9BACT|nr:PIN domain-containing protein [Dyadobacter pollutisoli]WAC13732.1 PIN domain-containing protein [Dyadobacter pollutisoli]
MTLSSFLDSNVILYLFDLDERKQTIAQNLVSQNPIINPQVLVEVGNICKRKFGFTKKQVSQLWEDLMIDCVCDPVSGSTIENARKLIARYDFQLFDSIIVAGALEANCSILYSEDMQHGLLVENKLEIVNPFL